MFQRKEVIGKERVAHDKKFSSREASSCSSSSGFGVSCNCKVLSSYGMIFY